VGTAQGAGAGGLKHFVRYNAYATNALVNGVAPVAELLGHTSTAIVVSTSVARPDTNATG
jgi:hypothetical protein